MTFAARNPVESENVAMCVPGAKTGRRWVFLDAEIKTGAVLLENGLRFRDAYQAGGDQSLRIELPRSLCSRMRRYIVGCLAAGSSASLWPWRFAYEWHDATGHWYPRTETRTVSLTRTD